MESDEQTNDLSSNELKDKLRQIRSNFTRSKNILDELEGYYQAFVELRAKLDDDKDGLEVNLDWSQTKKAEIDALVASVKEKVAELEEKTESTKSVVENIQARYDAFVPIAAKLTDPNTGVDATLTSATNLKNKIEALLETARADSVNAKTALDDIDAKQTEVEEAFTSFMELKEKIDDPEDGVEAQIAAINKYAKDAAKAKNDAEAELSSVIALKTTATENLDSIKDSKQQIEELQTESKTLTDDIRNNLGLSAADSLSKAIHDQRVRFDESVKRWAVGVWVMVTILVAGLGFIYYTLFIDKESGSYILGDKSITGASIILTVLSKALFSSPLVFALYFVASNFSRVRELRDNYIGKEIAAKNLQAYVKLLRDEFGDYDKQRLDFTLRNMQMIYDDPTLNKKKKRYNIGVNKIFQFDVQEEDIQALKDTLVEGAEELIDKTKTAK